MSLRSRRFSLDSSVSSEGLGVGLLGGLRGSKIGKKARKSQTLEEAELDIQELGQSLDRNNSLRSQTIEEEGLEPSDGIITKSSFVKHNKTFHKLFQDIPEDENLTHVFTCALQKEVLYHGKLFVSENYICFYSSVLLKDTKVAILASTVKEVKKQSSALSMLSVRTVDGEKYSFVSLRNREMCYKLLSTVCSQAQQEESANSSPHGSSAENLCDQGTISGYSSPDDSVDTSTHNSISLDNDLPLLPNRVSPVPERCSSTPMGRCSSTDEQDRAGSWIWSLTERVTSFLLMRGISNLSIIFYIYLLLVVLLLLTSGYIGLRIIALEEQLNSLGALDEFSLNHREHQRHRRRSNTQSSNSTGALEHRYKER